MPFTDPPPTGAPFATPVFESDGTTIRAIELSPVWQQWFGTFQAGVGTLQTGVQAMGISLAQLQSEIATLTQDNVDSIGAAIFGEDYKGKWVARTHNVGNVRSYDGRFYKCIVGRTSANTANPGSDATGWELIGSAADLSSLSDDNINAIGGASFGSSFQGTWEAGIFAVGGVVYHGGFFYECTVARTAANTDDPSVDAGSWSITSTTDESGDVSQAVQVAIDAQARIEYGASYKEEWSAGVYAVGDVVYHDGVFYECDVARAAADTDAPATDTTGWSPKASSEGGITQAVQNAIDAQAAINFGDNYKGAWEVGAYAIGNVVYYGGSFYECDTARTAANTDDPSTDSTGWSVKTVTFEIMGDVAVDLTSVTNAIQDVIDAQGTANFGDKYKGSWSAGIFAVDDVSYHDGAFYTCTVARVAANTSNPATDTASWSIEVAESGGLDTAVQNAIDAQAAISFGSKYKGTWAAGVYAVEDIVFYDRKFYECAVARVAANTDDPSVDTTGWSEKTSLDSQVGTVESKIDSTRTELSDAQTSIEGMVDQARTGIGDVDTKVDQARTDISGIRTDVQGDVSDTVQNAINAQATASYGDDYKGPWSAGTYAVGDVVYHSGAFYTCDTARSSSNTSNPAADTGSWTIKLAETGGLSQAVQDAIDAQAKISFGENYKGKWEAGSYAVGDVVSHSGSFFECDTARSSSNTNNPAADTATWSVKESIEGGVTRAINNTIDALGAATFGDDYTGEWEAGVHSVGDVVSYNIRFYECNTARNAGHTNNPSVNTGAWHLVGSAVTIRANLQDNIDSMGAASYGNQYTGLWEAGVHAVDDYVSYGGRFYRCKVARTSSNSSDPSADNTGWEAIGSSFVLQGNITTAKQENIDAAARIVFGDDYKGKWAIGAFAVGDVTYDEVTEKFYECDTARTSSNTSRPSINTTAWSLLDALKTNVANSLGLSQVKSQVFTSSGTWTRPANVAQVRVFLVGGGGAGGGGKGSSSTGDTIGGAGGAGGQVVDTVISVSGNVAVTIGAGGDGGDGGPGTGFLVSSRGESGADGGNTSFGSIVAKGGGGGGKDDQRYDGGVDINGFGSATGFPYGVSSPYGGSLTSGNQWPTDGEAIFLYGEAGAGGTPTNSRGGGGGGGGSNGAGGAGGNKIPFGTASQGQSGGSAAANSGSGGGAGGGARSTTGVARFGGDGGDGGSGYAVVFWTE